MALTTTETTTLRELLKGKYSALFASKTDTEIDTLIGYGDELVNDSCVIRLLAIEYWVCFQVDTEANSTSTTGSLIDLDIGDIKASYGEVEVSDSVYAVNLYGRLYLQVMKDCSKMFVGIIA